MCILLWPLLISTLVDQRSTEIPHCIHFAFTHFLPLLLQWLFRFSLCFFFPSAIQMLFPFIFSFPWKHFFLSALTNFPDLSIIYFYYVVEKSNSYVSFCIKHVIAFFILIETFILFISKLFCLIFQWSPDFGRILLLLYLF